MFQRDANRTRIVKLVSICPGIHLREIQRALGLSFNAIRYNTQRLVKSGEISCEKTTGHSRFFLPSTQQEYRIFYICVRNDTTFRILQALTEMPLISSKDLAEHTGFAKSTISEHIHDLLSHNLVRITLSDEGNFKVELLNRERIGPLVASEMQMRESGIVANFVDLWDF